MKLCVVGSRAIEVDGAVAVHIVELLSKLPKDSTVMVRKPMTRSLRPFEAMVTSMAATMGLRAETFAPEPGGRGKVFSRDIEMVAAADEVVAFFADGDEMTGGTAHVVDKAIDQQKPVRAYAIAGPELRLIADEDWTTEGQW